MQKNLDLQAALQRIENIAGGSFVFQMHANGRGHFPYISPGLLARYQLDAEEISEDASSLLRLVHPDELDSLAAAFTRSSENLSQLHHQQRITSPSLGTRWILVTAAPESQQDGSTVWAGQATDVTEHKNQLDGVLEAVGDGSWDWDISNNLVCFSSAWKRMLGYADGQITTSVDAWRSLVHMDDKAQYLTALNAHVNGETKAYTHEYRIRCSNGSYKTVLDRGRVVSRTEEGSPLRAVGTYTDITAHRQCEVTKMLQAHAIEAAPVGIIIADACEPEFPTIYANQTFCDITGYGLSEVLHRNLRFLQSDYRNQPELKQIRQALTKGTKAKATLTNFRKDGTRFWNELTIKPVRNEGNELTHFVAAIRDVTREQKLYGDLAQSERQFRTLAKNIPIGIFIGNTHGKINYVNEKFSALTSLSFDEAIKTDWGERIHEDDRAAAISSWRNALDAGVPLDIHFRFIRKDQSIVWIAASSVSVDNALGERVSRIGIFVDVTEQRRSEEALRDAKNEAEKANRTKSLFLAKTRRELKTSLNSVMGLSQIMTLADDLPSHHSKNAHEIYSASDYLLHLIEELADLSAIQAGEYNLAIESIELEKLLSDVSLICQPLTQEHSMDLFIDQGNLAGNYVLADFRRLKQIIVNLVSNAMKYGKEGAVVEVKCNARTNHIRISIIDKGPGLSPEQIDRVFDPFERLGKKSVDIPRTGFGLTICKELLTAMGGRLGVDSEVGIGSTFWIELPLSQKTSDDRPGATGIPDEQLSDGVLARLGRVLVAEDNPTNQHQLQQVLQRWNIDADICTNGREALMQLNLENYQVVLTDVQMPHINGVQLTEMIRKQELGTAARMYIIGISAHAMESERRRCLAAGMDDYITKPIELNTLREALEQCAISCDSEAR